MKNIKRTLITVLAMLLVCVLSVSATLAYLFKQSETVTNTFSVGNVDISLDEADVDDSTSGKDRDTENKYKLTSGATLAKDPTVHVSRYSEEAYIFVKVVVTDAVKNVLVDDSETGSIASQMAPNWTLLDGEDNVYYYKNTVSGLKSDGTAGANEVDLVVFNTISVKKSATGAQLAQAAVAGQSISVTAYAIQADTIKDASKSHAVNASVAWSALQDELNKLS